MNNNQFILIVLWISMASALIGIHIGGVVVGVIFMISMPMIFLVMGD